MTPDFSTIAPGSNYANLIHTDPPIVLGWTGRLFRFGSASVLAPLFRHRRLVFLLIAKGSVADDADARELAADALPFVAAHPQHRFEWLCNIAEEATKLRALGLSAHTHNQNLFLREEVYRPLAAPLEFDAVYNGRLSPEKRNELAASVGRVAFIAYRDPGEQSVEAFHAAWKELARLAPQARLLNRLTENGCQRLTPAEVNLAYARSSVGLCLSPREGAMRVAMEYQLAGLPIVATPCRGGRDHHFDAESWRLVPPEAEAVRDGVAAMKRLGLPREWVRARALARLAHDRHRFVTFIQSLVDAENGSGRFEAAFEHLRRHDLFERWLPMRELAAETWARLGGD